MNTEKKRRPGALIYILFLILLVGGMYLFSRLYQTGSTASYNEYTKLLSEKKITYVTVVQNNEIPTGRLKYTIDGVNYSVNVTDVAAEEKILQEKGIEYEVKDVPGENYFLSSILPTLIIAAAVFIVMLIVMGRSGQVNGGGNPMAGFTRNRARMVAPDENGIKFQDVAGLHEEKEELEQVVDFLSNPDRYLALGARIPKGVLLVGPPGTGKTLLAKAVAGEAGVPFFTISGSDFVEMFVGVGASRVRELFADAKKNAPCIIFIDEIDAVARIRGAGMGGGHDEREQTLNQLLVEMDGFSVNEGIIVLAATNRVDILDPAILRPGRFDRKVMVGRPDVRGREEILNVHAKNKPLSDDVDLKRVAQTTAGFSGADLSNLLNEAAILAAREKRRFICQKDIDDCFVKVGIGQEKKSRIISDKEKRITAYHEMGHAILFHLLPEVGPVHTVSIIPTGAGAAGYTMPLPERDEMFNTKNKMLESIMVAMGGRIAEKAILGDNFTTGASQDIQQATAIARDMVMKYGMSDKIGFLNYEQEQDAVFMGRDLGHVKTFGQNAYNEIEAEVKRIIDECYTKAGNIISENRSVLDRGAALLIEEEKIGQEKFEQLFQNA